MKSSRSVGSRKVLFLTNIENGESNVFLATSQALLELDPDIEIHFATFRGFEESIIKTWQQTRQTAPRAKPIIYHEIKGKSMLEGVKNCFASGREHYERQDNMPESFTYPLRFSTTIRAIRDTVSIFLPYSGSEFFEIFSSVLEIISQVSANLVVVNSLMTPALTACFHLRVRSMCLSPNTIKDFAAQSQPFTTRLRYPALFSGFSYPVPWTQVPLNLFYNLYAGVSWITSKNRKEAQEQLRSEAGASLVTPLDLVCRIPRNLKILVSGLPELDFPLALPSHIFPCGPIVRKSASVSDVDTDLEAWLARGPTIYINMGTLFRTTETQAIEIAKALQIVLASTKEQKSVVSRFQVLWKLRKSQNDQAATASHGVHDILGHDIESDRVRIVDWIAVEPISVLQTGHIICSVHHGGANSFNEAVIAGVPQVVLPQWIDTYDFAHRIELLGIGRLGNRTTKPQIIAPDLARELLDILQGDSAEEIRKRANAFAKVCKAGGEGAKNAAALILAECDADLANP
ncbi:hypothetical protein CDD83_6953 [Cordyceps sp. RAO-2017]|nr:hypothetical protein CDD83_6953 [Cordyceps sp. RAO-2017]